MSRRRHSARQSGFTLLEVLIALALISVALMAMFGMFRTVAEVSADIMRHEQTAYGERALEGILFDDLRSAYTAGKTSPFVGKDATFQGTDSALLEFCTSASLTKQDTGASLSLQHVEYVLREEGDTKTLYRRERPYCGLSGDWEWIDIALFEDVDAIDIEYLNPADNTFASEWNNANSWPKAVRLSLEYGAEKSMTFIVGTSVLSMEGK